MKDSTKAAHIKDYGVLLEPVITEKSSMAGGDGSVVTFSVLPSASKTDIKGAVERIFDVDVKKVRTCNFIGKVKRTTRSAGRRSAYKKAYVTLKPGQSIDIVEGL